MIQWLLAVLAVLAGGPPGPPALPKPVPIGIGAGYRLPAGPVGHAGGSIAGMACSPGRAAAAGQVHLELFAHGRVLPVPAGVGIAPPRVGSEGFVTAGRCSYPLFTRDPTGVVQMASGAPATLGAFFRIWGQPLGRHRLCGFRSAAPVRAWLNGRRWPGPVASIPLVEQAEIVVELGRPVPPHSSYLFPEVT